MVTTRLYSDGKLKTEGFPVEDISDHISAGDCTVWADFASPTEADLKVIEEELGLHPLAVEDALHSSQRPKLDRYDTHFFLAAYAVQLDSATGQL
ncbi:MAG: magnesium transporter, partial [Microbacteriaceae bacterium]|nr:magnesium transporter [Microbacteriaceae bacterium]